MSKEKAIAEYASDLYEPIIRCSICTGEQVAGFRERRTGRFVEIMLIRNDRDIQEFRKVYCVEGEIRKIY